MASQYKDQAHRRLVQYYRHLLPELFQELDAGLAPSDVSGKDEPTLADYQLGWASQPEEFDYALRVEGRIPKELKGTLFRNGPGLLEVYGTPLVHPIDGDGMICSVAIEDGKAHFKSKFVRTSGFVTEHTKKKAVFRGMMGTIPEGSQKLSYNFKNPSNTNVFEWNGKLLSCWEFGLPYALDPATLETVGKDTLDGALDESKCLGAHFRVDPVSKNLFVFSFKLIPGNPTSFLYFHEFDQQYKLLNQWKFPLENYFYCHDFMLTENYFIVHHSPFYKMDDQILFKMISGEESPGSMVKYNPDMPSRFLVIARDKNCNPLERIRQFDIPPCHIYHHLNGFEDHGHIHITSVCFDENFTMEFEDKVGLSNGSVCPGRVIDFDLDLTQMQARHMQADDCSCEFPTIHTGLNGKNWRFGYLMAAAAPNKPLPYMEVVKYDRWKQRRQVWSARKEFGVIGEPIFIPRVDPLQHDPAQGHVDEDDGWVMTQLYDARNHLTQFVILDAKKVDQGPIARLHLDRHIPYGFHGTFSHNVFK
jgi:all-trans-8'-apo-beta-carotenal 15,15'-oxygenase